MTKEEAIARIKDHIKLHKYNEQNAVKIFEALDMAIKALEQAELCENVVNRQAAIDECNKRGAEHIGYAIAHLPSAESKIKPIEYQDCANAMLKMWMDNVVTDGEYNRIMDKLNAFWRMRNER